MSSRKHKADRGRASSRRTWIVGGVIAATIALTAGGTAVAGSLIGSPQIKDGGVYSPDIHDQAVRSNDLRDGGVHQNDLADRLEARIGNRLHGAKVFTSTQDFGPGGIGGVWCGAPNVNTEDKGWVAVAGGAELTSADVDAGVQVVSTWPHDDPLNPGWNVQVNKPTNVNPGNVTMYVVCVKG